MNPEFVSDLVETLLPSSCAFRRLVRSRTQVLADELENVSPSVAEIVRIAGGKCMGYPALWFAARALMVDEKTVSTKWEEYSAPILVSLSTSLIDDVLDDDTVQRAETVVAAYYLIFDALDKTRRIEIGRRLRGDLLGAIPSFVGAPCSDDMLAAGANRIGAFYAAIAEQAAGAFGAESARIAAVRSGALMFGQWICLLDDVIDVRRDAAAGRTWSVPLRETMTISTAPPQSLSVAWQRLLEGDLLRLRDYARDHKWEDLVTDLDSARVPLQGVAAAAAEEFHAFGGGKSTCAT